MSHCFTDALLSGRKGAVTELIGNEIYIGIANVMCAITGLKKKSKAEATPTASQTQSDVKAEIIEFNDFRNQVNSTINAEFTTIEEVTGEDMSEDEAANFINDMVDVVRNQSKLNLDDEKSTNDIKLITFAELLALNKIKFNQKLSTEFLKNRDDIIELNTIYKFLTGTKFFSTESVIQLNEYVTSQLLYDTTMAIYEGEDFSKNEVMTEIANKVRKRLEAESVSNVALSDSDVEAVSPIFFNQGILDSAFKKTDVKTKLTKTKVEYITNLLTGIVGQDWIQANNAEFEIVPKMDPIDPNRDTGMAVLCVKMLSQITHQFDLDLDTVTGNGFGLAIPSYMSGYQYPVNLFVSIEKFPKIIKNALERNFYTLNNPVDPDSVNEFIEVTKDTFGPDIYYRFDMSDMSKHLATLTNEEKVQLVNNLMRISNINWAAVKAEATGIGQQYRMRFRNFKSVNEFTLVSDKNTRQQLPDMLPVFGEQYKTYFKDPLDDVKDANIMVLKFKNDSISIAINGFDIKGVSLPPKPNVNN